MQPRTSSIVHLYFFYPLRSVKYSEKSENILCLDPCFLNSFLLFGPHLDYISRLIDCLVETLDYSMRSLSAIASSFGVTEENLLFETVQSGPTSFFRMFSPPLKKRTFICLYKVNKTICFAYYLISYFPEISSYVGFEEWEV